MPCRYGCDSRLAKAYRAGVEAKGMHQPAVADVAFRERVFPRMLWKNSHFFSYARVQHAMLCAACPQWAARGTFVACCAAACGAQLAPVVRRTCRMAYLLVLHRIANWEGILPAE